MAFLVIGLVAFLVSGLTLFAGFGLGTLLLPAFALFFPVEVAVAATAVVHLLNGLFKVAVLGRQADRRVILAFGVPAIVASGIGAVGLATLSAASETIGTWAVGPLSGALTPLGLVMGVLIVGFAVFELIPRLRKLRAPVKALPVGGALSGFFGGLSGHQGAMRAAFLAPLGLAPPVYAATQATLSVMVDLIRIAVYGIVSRFGALGGGLGSEEWSLVAVGTIAAFAGVLLGRKLLDKVTVDAIRWLTGALLLLVGTGLAVGVIGH